MCTAGIFAIIPAARTVQRLVYDTAGREFFTYSVLFIIGVAAITLLYFFIFRLKIKKVAKYFWLLACTGLYIYFTLQLRQYPEEALHFIWYGLLSYFLYRALSHKIKDRTVYISALLFVLFVGITDEFIQWMTPTRFWDYKDVGLNVLGGGLSLLALWKGVRPEKICMPASRISINMLIGIITINIFFMGFCLSNTPNIVKRYTDVIGFLSWFQNEEPMTEYGYKHNDPEIGAFYSRMSLEELQKIDLSYGEIYGNSIPADINSRETYKEFTKTYSVSNNPFLYEFAVHLFRKNSSFAKIKESAGKDEKIEMANTVFRENFILEKYFGNTLKHSGFALSEEKLDELKETASLWQGNYISNADGKIITSFNIKTVWIGIFVILITAWTAGEFFKRNLDA